MQEVGFIRTVLLTDNAVRQSQNIFQGQFLTVGEYKTFDRKIAAAAFLSSDNQYPLAVSDSDGDFRVIAIAAVVDLNTQILRYNAFAEENRLTPLFAKHCLHMVKTAACVENIGVCSFQPIQIIVAGAAVKEIYSIAAIEFITAAATIQGIIAGATDEVIAIIASV